MGLFSSLFGSKTKSKNSFEPWSESRDFLLGDNGEPGIFDEASRLYQSGGFNPQMQGVQQNYLEMLGNRSGGYDNLISPETMGSYAGAAKDLMGGAYAVANGAYDSTFGPVSNINIPQVELQSARSSQGPLDPTNSLSSLLSGQVQNPYLDQQAAAMTANLTRNLNENVMPGIRSEALASGQYGGSRQGIAEGLAASRLNQDLAPALTNLYGGAFENAQNRMTGVATDLNNQAVNNAQNNAVMNMGGQQFNANLGLQNNNQMMQQNQNNLNNRMQAMDISNNSIGLLSGAMGLQGQRNSLQDNDFSQYMGALGMPQDINWNNLGNYQNVIYPGAQLGGTSKGTQTSQPGIVPAVLGTVSGIAGIGRGLSGMSGIMGGR